MRAYNPALLVLTLWFALNPLVHAKDYRKKANRAEAELSYIEKDHTIRRAFSLGRASGALSTKDVDKIYEALEKKKAVPSELSNTWQKLLRISQLQTYTLDSQHFFPVGYEYETVHVNHSSGEDFEKGSKKFQKILDETMGKKSDRTYTNIAHMRDEENRKWKLMREFVRMNDLEASGYEFVSPPIRDPGSLQDISALTWKLGSKKIGQSNGMTGGHQTFTIVPNGEVADDKLIARMVTNVQLMEAQYSPAIFDILDIQRGGGPLNTFMRPIVMDHPELINSLKNQDPNKMTLKDVHDLFFDKHVDIEFERMLVRERDFAESIDQAQFDEMMKWGPEKRAKLPKLWKYRDAQTKFNLASPEKTLIEFRVGDWVADRPEQTMLKTFVYENMLKKAWLMAKEGKIFQPNIPLRKAGETDIDYWNRMRLNPDSSKEAFLKTLDITDPNKANLILGRNFKVNEPGFRTLERPSYAFENEGWTDDLVDVIVPNDGKLRTEWKDMSKKKKLKVLEKMGIEIGEYSEKASLRLSTEFRVDTARFPHMNPDIIMESSGNWEVTSNGRGLYSEDDLKKAMKPMKDRFEEFAAHVHRFTPDEKLEKIKKEPKKFAKLLERQSLAMALDGYAETEVDEAYHALDSWSLDRFSPKDLERIEGHLKGTDQISGTQTKYHNIAFRPVTGGLDMEVRDLGDDVDSGLRQMDSIAAAMDEGNFGPDGAEKSPDLFMEFADHKDPYSAATKRYTLLDAVEKKHKLTEAQKKLLHKLQFEIYKPSMANYMYFTNPESKDPFWSHNDIPAKYLDPKMARTNFENNMAIPLLNYEEQTYLSAADKAKLARGKEEYAERIYQLMLKVEKDPKYKFLLEEENFLHLSDYLERSTHPDAKKIDFKKAKGKDAAKQRELLEELTNKVRGETIRFVRDTKANMLVRASLPTRNMAKPAATAVANAVKGCGPLYKGLQ